MNEWQGSIEIIVFERNDFAGKYGAFLYQSNNMDAGDIDSLTRVSIGNGDTPLGAAAALLNAAVAEKRRRGAQ